MSAGDRVKVSDSDKVIFRNLQVSEKNEQLFFLGIFMFCIFTVTKDWKEVTVSVSGFGVEM
jgi:hypothetical protein